MKRLFPLLICFLLAGHPLSAQPDTSPNPTASAVQLQQEVNDLKIALEKHEMREGFYSELTNAHVNWMIALLAVVVAAGGVLFGFISWRKVQSAREDLQATFDAQMKKHQAEDITFRSLVNQDRINLKRLASNLCFMNAETCFGQNNYKIGFQYAFDALIHDRYTDEFFLSLDPITQKELEQEEWINEFKRLLFARLKVIKKHLEELKTQDKVDPLLFGYLLKGYDVLNLRFYFDDDRIETLLQEIIAILLPYSTEEDPEEEEE